MQVASTHPPQLPFHFFPKSSSSHTHLSSVVVKKRLVSKPHPSLHPPPRPLDDLLEQRLPQVPLTAEVLAARSSTKRRSPYAHAQRRAKRARSSDSSDATPPPSSSRSRESSIASFASSSRASTRNRSSPPTSLPPSTRSRSRSSSVLPITDEPIPRECHINEDTVFDEAFLSSEKVVLRLMKSYVQYFKNPNDPHDRSFDPHPTNYPVAELEFPNSGASERYVPPFFFFASARPWHLAIPCSVTFTSFMVFHAHSSLQHVFRAFCYPETWPGLPAAVI
ncbi:hypothetical protein BC827DRAFT_118497 [Russula dissimulans]|nr:hypothetical protein BC827DRAFT_118497 [Russula dissimulans]